MKTVSEPNACDRLRSGETEMGLHSIDLEPLLLLTPSFHKKAWPELIAAGRAAAIELYEDLRKLPAGSEVTLSISGRVWTSILDVITLQPEPQQFDLREAQLSIKFAGEGSQRTYSSRIKIPYEGSEHELTEQVVAKVRSALEG